MGGCKSEVGGCKSEVGGCKLEVGGCNSEMGGCNSEVEGCISEVGGMVIPPQPCTIVVIWYVISLLKTFLKPLHFFIREVCEVQIHRVQR